MSNFSAKLVQEGSVFHSVTALSVVLALKAAGFVFFDLRLHFWLRWRRWVGILELADWTMVPIRTIATKVRASLMADAAIDTKELTVLSCHLVTKVLSFILAILSSVGAIFRGCTAAVTVVLVAAIFSDSHALASVEAMVCTTLAAHDFAVGALESNGALAILIVVMLLKEIIQEFFTRWRDSMNSEPADTSVVALHRTIWDTALLKLTMRSIVIGPTMAWATWVILIVALAPATVDAEDVPLVVTSLGLGDLAVLPNVFNTVFIDSLGAVTI